jgi:carboxypeptidase Q
MNANRRRILWAALIAVFAFGSGRFLLRAQEPQADQAKEAWVDMDQKILAEVQDHNEIMANLEYLSDMIGGRLTGSDNLTKASHWTQQRFAAYRLENVHLEPWQIAHAWHRATATGRIVAPAEHPLTLAAYGWTPATPGTVRGRVVYVKASSMDELRAYSGKLKGAIVITAEPSLLPSPDAPAPNPMLIPYGDPFLLVAPRSPEARAVQRGPGFFQYLRQRNQFFKDEGVLATLTDSGKPDGLLNMTGLGGEEYKIAPLPAAFVTSENYSLIWRLMKRGPVEVELNLQSTFTDAPVEVYNTVAEIRGTENPDEVVILGAHIDSWDLGTGSTDNGTGSMVVLEAARTLERLHVRPRRTIRFILFSGEEQGLNGSRAYVAAHTADLSKISGVLIHDTGTGRVISISLSMNYWDREIMDRVVAPLKAVGLLELSERTMRGTDHVPFDDAGVPGFYCIQEPAQYFQTHHTQADTFDQAHEADLVEGAQVLAVWAYNTAELPELLPRAPAGTKKGDE